MTFFDRDGNFVLLSSSFWQKTLISHRNITFSDLENSILTIRTTNVLRLDQVSVIVMHHGLRNPYLSFTDSKRSAFNLLTKYQVNSGVNFHQILNSNVTNLETINPYDVNPDTGEPYGKNTTCVLVGKEESGWTGSTRIYYDRIDPAEVASGLFYSPGKIDDWETRTTRDLIKMYNGTSYDTILNPEDFVEGPITGPFATDALLETAENSLVFQPGKKFTLGSRVTNQVEQWDGQKVPGFFKPNSILAKTLNIYRGPAPTVNQPTLKSALGINKTLRNGIPYIANEFPLSLGMESRYIGFSPPSEIYNGAGLGSVCLQNGSGADGKDGVFVLTNEKSFCLDFFIKPTTVSFSAMKSVWFGMTGFAIGSIGPNNQVGYYYRNPNTFIPIAGIPDEEIYVRIYKGKGSDTLSVYVNDSLVSSSTSTTNSDLRIGMINIGGCPAGPYSNNWSTLIKQNEFGIQNYMVAEVRVLFNIDEMPTGIPTMPWEIVG